MYPPGAAVCLSHAVRKCAKTSAQLPVPEKAQLLRKPDLKQYLGVPLVSGNGRPLGILGLAE